MGDDDKMRGYYNAALCCKVLLDGQIECRMPVWNIFGIVGRLGAGECSQRIHISLDGLWLSYDAGLWVRVYSGNNIDMRFDVGFGPEWQ